MSLIVGNGLVMLVALAMQDSLGLSNDAPIEVTAGRCEALEMVDTMECTGNVRVKQGEAILTAEKVTIFGTNSEEGFERIEGEGTVRYAAGENAVSGDHAVYDGTANTITVTGDVVVIQGDQIMAGGRLVYNTVTRAIQFEPGPDGRVRGLFHTAESERN